MTSLMIYIIMNILSNTNLKHIKNVEYITLDTTYIIARQIAN